MAVSKRLEDFLKANKVDYEVMRHPETYTASHTAEAVHLPGREVVKVVMVKVNGTDAMVLVPSDHTVDLLKLAQFFATSNLRIEGEGEFEHLFADCERGSLPPIGRLYHLPCYLDERLKHAPEIVFNAGSPRYCIRVSTAAFLKVAKGRYGDFSVKGRKLVA